MFASARPPVYPSVHLRGVGAIRSLTILVHFYLSLQYGSLSVWNDYGSLYIILNLDNSSCTWCFCWLSGWRGYNSIGMLKWNCHIAEISDTACVQSCQMTMYINWLFSSVWLSFLLIVVVCKICSPLCWVLYVYIVSCGFVDLYFSLPVSECFMHHSKPNIT